MLESDVNAQFDEEEDPLRDIEPLIFSQKRADLHIDFVVEDDIWTDFLKEHQNKISDIIALCFDRAMINLPKDVHSNISLTFLDNHRIQEINNEWRGKDKATNVLSFPTFSPEEIEEKEYLQAPINEFGDVIIAWNYCKDEAKNANIPFDEHIFHMVIHGILHILGYDHIEMSDAETMEALEINILNAFGYQNPYK